MYKILYIILHYFVVLIKKKFNLSKTVPTVPNSDGFLYAKKVDIPG
jgi:hypothetical protein